MKLETVKKLKTLQRFVETVLFACRWVLPFFYVILFAALVIYAYVDVKEFVEYVGRIKHVDKDLAMLTFIELIDMTMIANLGKMIITGSYNSFVSKLHGYQNENIGSGLLKVKMGTSLVGVTAIALLQRTINAEQVSWDTLQKLGFVHGIFLFSSVGLAIVDYWHNKNELAEKEFDLKLEHLEEEKKSKQNKHENSNLSGPVVSVDGVWGMPPSSHSEKGKNHQVPGL